MNDYLDDEVQIADERDLIHDGALQRPIRELPELHPVVAASPHDSLRTVINLMIDKRVGCALIVEDGRLAGVFNKDTTNNRNQTPVGFNVTLLTIILICV